MLYQADQGENFHCTHPQQPKPYPIPPPRPWKTRYDLSLKEVWVTVLPSDGDVTSMYLSSDRSPVACLRTLEMLVHLSWDTADNTRACWFYLVLRTSGMPLAGVDKEEVDASALVRCQPCLH